VLRTIVACGAVVAAAMGGVKDGRLLEKAGLTGSCHVLTTAQDGTQMTACRPGWLEGAPDLTRHACSQEGGAGAMVYWRCPAPVVSRQGT
jgi:hypothetical protein